LRSETYCYLKIWIRSFLWNGEVVYVRSSTCAIVQPSTVNAAAEHPRRRSQRVRGAQLERVLLSRAARRSNRVKSHAQRERSTARSVSSAPAKKSKSCAATRQNHDQTHARQARGTCARPSGAGATNPALHAPWRRRHSQTLSPSLSAPSLWRGGGARRRCDSDDRTCA